MGTSTSFVPVPVVIAEKIAVVEHTTRAAGVPA